eukprot:13315942-Alexandrium_andersonii.AAC.1
MGAAWRVPQFDCCLSLSAPAVWRPPHLFRAARTRGEKLGAPALLEVPGRGSALLDALPAVQRR